jgi:selenocysteine-specific elongation factor
MVEFQTGEGVCFVHQDFIRDIADKMSEYLNRYHSNNPLRFGVSKEEIKSRIFEGNIKQKIFDAILFLLEEQKVIKTNKKYVSLYEFEIKLSEARSIIRDRLLEMYKSSGIAGIKYEDAVSYFKDGAADARMVLDLLIDTGEIVKINDEMVVAKEAYDNALAKLKLFLEKNNDITLAQYRDVLDTSRKFAVGLLEYFDQVKITKRLGDKRVLF